MVCGCVHAHVCVCPFVRWTKTTQRNGSAASGHYPYLAAVAIFANADELTDVEAKPKTMPYDA